jgi:hypothetical protein
MARSGGVAVRLRRHREALAFNYRAECVLQCAGGGRPRRILGRDVGPPAVVLGWLLHGCYTVGPSADHLGMESRQLRPTRSRAS